MGCRLKKCCFCCQPKIGAHVYNFVNVVIDLATLITVIVILVHNLSVWLLILAVIYSVFLISDLIFFLGLFQRNSGLVLTWLLIHGFRVIFMIAFGIFSLFTAISNPYYLIVLGVFYGYMWFVGYSIFGQFQEEQCQMLPNDQYLQNAS